MKIAVIGGNDFALANAYFLASRQHEVTWICENVETKQEFDSGSLVTYDEAVRALYASQRLTLSVAVELEHANFNLIVFSQEHRLFDEGIAKLDKSITECIDLAAESERQPILLIRATLPIGYVRGRFSSDPLVAYMPKFEKNLYELVHAKRVVVGGQQYVTQQVANAYELGNPLFVGATEAEAFKITGDLHSAMMQSFFNEVDQLGYASNFNAGAVIEALVTTKNEAVVDSNPNFGYGDDLRQIAQGFASAEEFPIFAACHRSNTSRAYQIAARIVELKPAKIYVYLMRDGCQTKFEGSTAAVVKILCEISDADLIVYDPDLDIMPDWFGGTHVRELDVGELGSDCVLVANQGTTVTDFAASMGVRVITCEYKVY